MISGASELMFRARKVLRATMILAILGPCPAIAQNTRLLGSARSVLVQSDVIFNKQRRFDSDAVPFSYIYRSGLLKSFRQVTVNPDIIIKFHKDVFLIDDEKISLSVFDADDNGVLYSEERKLVDEENDVNRLVAHFLARVKVERDAIAAKVAAEVEQEKKRNSAERDSKAVKEAEVILSIYSSSDSLLQAIIEENRSKPNECHVFLRDISSQDKADVVLSERVKKGIYMLKLTSRGTNEILHTEVVPEKSAKRAIALMSKWITSTPWE